MNIHVHTGCWSMKSYIYVDVLFFVNLVVNYVILLAAGKMTDTPAHGKRVALVSCLGALYSVSSLVLPYQPLFSFPARILAGLLMVTLSYPEAKGISFVHLATAFYTCSILVAGCALALNMWGKPFLTRLSLYYPSARWWTLAVALGLVSAGCVIWKALNLSPVRQFPLMQVEIALDGQSICLKGMVDTGNQLRDPLSGLPVIIVDWDSLKPIIPQEMSYFFQAAWDKAASKLASPPAGTRLRLIPFTGVSGNSGILPGFKPDALYLTGKQGRFKKAAVVGVSGKPLSRRGLYQALLHPELVSFQGGVLI